MANELTVSSHMKRVGSKNKYTGGLSSVCRNFLIKAPFHFPMVTVSKAGSVMTWAPELGSSLNGREVVSRPLASGSEGGWRVLCAQRMITEATRRLTTEQGSGMDHP